MSTMTIVDMYETRVCELNTPEITQTALKTAYYSAMLDACINDPMDDEKDQEEYLTMLKARLLEHTEAFQTLVNAKL